jgi:hypothetical protein
MSNYQVDYKIQKTGDEIYLFFLWDMSLLNDVDKDFVDVGSRYLHDLNNLINDFAINTNSKYCIDSNDCTSIDWKFVRSNYKLHAIENRKKEGYQYVISYDIKGISCYSIYSKGYLLLYTDIKDLFRLYEQGADIYKPFLQQCGKHDFSYVRKFAKAFSAAMLKSGEDYLKDYLIFKNDKKYSSKGRVTGLSEEFMNQYGAEVALEKIVNEVNHV